MSSNGSSDTHNFGACSEFVRGHLWGTPGVFRNPFIGHTAVLPRAAGLNRIECVVARAYHAAWQMADANMSHDAAQSIVDHPTFACCTLPTLLIRLSLLSINMKY